MLLRLAMVLSGIALARVLAPADFGVYAVALAVTNILMSFNDVGMGFAIVRWRGDVAAAASTAQTIVGVTSIVLYTACFAGSSALADGFDSPESAGVLRLLSSILLIDGIITVPRGLLYREFRQDRLTVGEVASIPVSVSVSIGAAVAGAGAWSLAFGTLAGALVNGSLVLKLAPFVPRPAFDRQVAAQLMRFGIPLGGGSLVEHTLLNIDYLIIGSILGPVPLGFYLLAFNISSWPSTVMTQAIRRVSIAGFSELSDDDAAWKAGFAHSFGVLVTLLVPMVAGLVVLAGPVVLFVYGDKWLASVETLRFLAVLGGARVLSGFVWDLLVGLGRSQLALFIRLIWLAVLLPALIIGTNRGDIRGTALAHSVVALGLALPLFALVLAHIGVDLRALAGRVTRPLMGAAAASLVGLGTLAALDATTGTGAALGPNLLRILVVGPLMLGAHALIAVGWRNIRSGGWLRPASDREGLGV